MHKAGWFVLAYYVGMALVARPVEILMFYVRAYWLAGKEKE